MTELTLAYWYCNMGHVFPFPAGGPKPTVLACTDPGEHVIYEDGTPGEWEWVTGPFATEEEAAAEEQLRTEGVTLHGPKGDKILLRPQTLKSTGAVVVSECHLYASLPTTMFLHEYDGPKGWVSHLQQKREDALRRGYTEASPYRN